MTDRTVPIVIDDQLLVVVAEQRGPVPVADDDHVIAKLGKVTGSIERISSEVLEAVKRASPDKATVELGFSLAIEQGQLVALFGKGKGEASIAVTLEWSRAGKAEE